MAEAQRRGLALVKVLYRSVLRVHHDRLPEGPMRDLGTTYARAEFKAHLRGKTTQPQWQQFFEQWRQYVSMLRGEAESTANYNAVEGAYEHLSDDQRKRLDQLKEEIHNTTRQGDESKQ